MKNALGPVILGMSLFTQRASAWTHNEHTRMTQMAIVDETATFSRNFPARLDTPPLDASARRALVALWEAARSAHPGRAERLCVALDQDGLSQGDTPTCVSFASLPAFAADHTCSATGLGAGVITKDNWQRRVLVVAQRFDQEVRNIQESTDAGAEKEAEIANERRDQDLALLAADNRYVSRAKDNRSHFQMPRGSEVASLGAYLRQTLEAGAQINGSALYVVYHQRALRFASAAVVAPNAGALAWAAILNEVYALHFIEDAFSSGHIVGGSAQNEPDGLRLGTHDYYSGHGYPMTTWSGRAYPGFGDGFATEADYVHAASAVRESLRQLARAAGAEGPCGGAQQARPGLCPDEIELLNAVHLSEIDSCAPGGIVPAGLARFADAPLVHAVLRHTPMPAPREPPPPMFVGENGVFGLAGAAVSLGLPLYLSGPTATSTRFLADTTMTLGVGFATDGVTSSRRDSVLFGGFIGAAQVRGSDSRLGVGAKIRLPYILFPGDVLLWPAYALLGRCGSGWACFARFSEKATRASSLLPLGFLPPIEVQFNRRTTFKFDVGRETSFVALFDVKAGDYAGWEVTVPYATLRTHWFDQDIAGDDLFGLSLRFGDDRAHGWFIGPSLTYTRVGRWYTSRFE